MIDSLSLPALREIRLRRLPRREAVAYGVLGAATVLAAHVAIQVGDLEHPGATLLLGVLVATAVRPAAGFAAAAAATAFFVANDPSPDLGEPFVFAGVALALPYLAHRSRKDAARVRESARLYRSLVEELPVGIYLDSPGDTENLYSNPAIVEMLGWTAEEWQQPGFFATVLHPDDRDRVLAESTGTAEGTFDDTYRVRRKDGEYRWVHDRGVLVRDARGRPLHVQGVLLDVTDAKDAEAQALVAARRYQSLVEHLPLVTYIEDAREIGRTVYISPQVEELLGYPVERWLGERDFFFQVLDPGSHEEIRRRRSDERTTQNFRLIAADGTDRWIHSERITIHGADGRPLYVQGFWVDMTEMRALEQRLAQQDRLDAVGQLAAGIAHNFNNMLVAIRGYADLAATRRTVDEARRDLGIVTGTSDRAADLVRHLLAFSRRQVLEPRETDMCLVVGELLEMLRHLLGGAVDVEVDVPEEPVLAYVDRAQLEQALVNLAINARDAMPDGGTLSIVVRAVTGGQDRAAGALIAVSDTGTGIEPAHAARVFDPFFTTKPAGTGLGLATAVGTVRQSGGELRLAHTTPGEGTTFEIYLPARR